MSKHTNNSNCDKCDEIFDTYPGFHQGLRDWFKAFQKKTPDAHISCAGRGKDAQEAAFVAKTSKAHWTQSSHNYNCALDIFRLTQAGGASWDAVWFRDKVGSAVFNQNCAPNKTFSVNWYGAPHAPFRELPHCEVDSWKDLLAQALIKLVE